MLEFVLAPRKELSDMKRKAIEFSQDNPYLLEEKL